MSIQNSDFFHACAKVGVAAGVPSFTNQRGFAGTITDNGPGDYTLTLDQEIDSSARAVHVTPTSGATFATATVADVNDASVRVRTFDAAGAPLDNVGFAISVLRFEQ